MFRLYFLFKQNILNLIPREIDWDLKQNISKKLEKLEKRTQKAIAEILETNREKLSSITTEDNELKE